MQDVKDILNVIDGVTEINGGSVKTRFGWTSINNVSSGSKLLILGVVRPDIIIQNCETGDNACREAFRVANNTDLHLYLDQPIQAIDTPEQLVNYNGVEMTAEQAFNKSYELFGDMID
jgi:hypothetical protein